MMRISIIFKKNHMKQFEIVAHSQTKAHAINFITTIDSIHPIKNEIIPKLCFFWPVFDFSTEKTTTYFEHVLLHAYVLSLQWNIKMICMYAATVVVSNCITLLSEGSTGGIRNEKKKQVILHA